MIRCKKNQTVIIGGQSGSGKTESVKLLIEHYSYLSNTSDLVLIEKVY
jgi:myosin heavy subunit